MKFKLLNLLLENNNDILDKLTWGFEIELIVPQDSRDAFVKALKDIGIRVKDKNDEDWENKDFDIQVVYDQTVSMNDETITNAPLITDQPISSIEQTNLANKIKVNDKIVYQPKYKLKVKDILSKNITNQDFKKYKIDDKLNQDDIFKATDNLEIRTRVLSDDEVIPFMKDLLKKLKIIGGQTNETCGFHVHFSFNDKRIMYNPEFWKELYRNIKGDEIFKTFFPSRKDSKFAKYYDNEEEFLQNAIKHFSAISIMPLARLGTIELRFAEMTFNIEKIKNYILFLREKIQQAYNNVIKTNNVSFQHEDDDVFVIDKTIFKILIAFLPLKTVKEISQYGSNSRNFKELIQNNKKLVFNEKIFNENSDLKDEPLMYLVDAKNNDKMFTMIFLHPDALYEKEGLKKSQLPTISTIEQYCQLMKNEHSNFVIPYPLDEKTIQNILNSNKKILLTRILYGEIKKYSYFNEVNYLFDFFNSSLKKSTFHKEWLSTLKKYLENKNS